MTEWPCKLQKADVKQVVLCPLIFSRCTAKLDKSLLHSHNKSDDR